MKVLWFHERRPQSGEDPVVSAQAILLRANGIEVCEAQPSSYEHVRKLVEHHSPDIAHVHNCGRSVVSTVHRACCDAGIATVQSLYDFRWLCLNGRLSRNNQACDDCLGRTPWKGIARRCGGSLVSSISSAREIARHRNETAWKRTVCAFIVPTEACWDKFVVGGIPATRIFVRPQFTGDPGDPPTPPSDSDVVLYLGQFATTDDVDLLLAAWKYGALSNLGRLMVAGDGPERKRLERAVSQHGLSPAAVIFTGRVTPVEILRLIWGARAVVAPSSPAVLTSKIAVKALSCGRPVVCSDLSDAAELIHNGTSGLKFKAGDPSSLADALEFALADDTIADCMGEVARNQYLVKYSPEQNYQILMRVYRFAIERKGSLMPPELMEFEPAQAMI